MIKTNMTNWGANRIQITDSFLKKYELRNEKGASIK